MGLLLPFPGLALSTFFALHRPISVTQLMPKTVSDDTFAQIFATRTRKNKVSDVLSTLSQTVSDLEEPLSRMSIANEDQQRSHDGPEADEGTAKLSLRHSDGSETNLHIQFNSLSGQYLPYAPPPPPEPLADVPEADAEAAAAVESEEVAEQAQQQAQQKQNRQQQQQPETQTRVYKAMVTIEETVDADGQVKVVAHSPELIEEGEDTATTTNTTTAGRPRSFLERLAWRQLQYDEARRQQDRAMQAISVRRQRKLKMKKKKYKKLMRKTRNMRRKLDRL